MGLIADHTVGFESTLATREWLSSISTNVCNRCRTHLNQCWLLFRMVPSLTPGLLIIEKNSRDFFLSSSWQDATLCLERAWIKQVVCGKSSGHTHEKFNVYHAHPPPMTFNVCHLRNQQCGEKKKEREKKPAVLTAFHQPFRSYLLDIDRHLMERV